jgi:hypothetical protein
VRSFSRARIAINSSHGKRPLARIVADRWPPLAPTKGRATDRLDAGKLKGEIMGTVYRKTVTKPLPTDAKIIVRKRQ